MDNVFVERLWRSVKYEDGYLRADETPSERRAGLKRYFEFYNTKRRHSALDRRTPDTVYFDQATPKMAAMKPWKIPLRTLSKLRGPLLEGSSEIDR
jgi:putative transposase